MSDPIKLLITIYQEYLNNGRKERRFDEWVKFVGSQHRYENAIVAVRKSLEAKGVSLIPCTSNLEPSPLIIISKYIVETLVLPKRGDSMFAAQVDILQELEGAPYYGAVHTAELLGLILKKVKTRNVRELVDCFGNGINGDTSALFKKCPARSFMACGANWKPADINILGVYDPVFLEDFNMQFERWLENNSDGDEQSTYQGKYFSDFVKHIRGPKGFGQDAKMYWVKDGEICIVDPSESTDCYGNTGRWMWFVD